MSHLLFLGFDRNKIFYNNPLKKIAEKKTISFLLFLIAIFKEKSIFVS